MELLTKYRPLRPLDFYQRKVLNFIYSAEGFEDIRTCVPFSDLGFDSPLHFIRCIPPDMCKEYERDKLFQRLDNALRKGNRAFLVSEDGRIQSAIYKGQRETEDGKVEAVLDGHRLAYPIERVVPYKEFLRRNIGSLLIDGPHKIVGSNVEYEEPTWDQGQELYYKPSKRWGVITNRYSLKGRAMCAVKLEQTPVKKEKIFRLHLGELVRDSIPQRIPIIPKNFANKKDYEAIKEPNTQEEVKKPEKPLVNKLNETKASPIPCDGKNAATSRNNHITAPTAPNLPPAKHPSNVNESGNQKVMNFSKSVSSSDSDTDLGMTTSDNDTTDAATHDIRQTVVDSHYALSHHQNENNNRKEEDYSTDNNNSVIIRGGSFRKAGRPLTEYFHSRSVDVTEDENFQNFIEPDLKSKSVNNLNIQPSSDEEDEEIPFDNYTNSLRKSARNVLAKQLAHGAQLGKIKPPVQNRSTFLSSDNLRTPSKAHEYNDTIIMPSATTVSQMQIREPLQIRRHELPQYTPTPPTSTMVSINGNGNDSSDSDEPPPPLPKSAPPLSPTQNHFSLVPQPSSIVVSRPVTRNASFKRAFSLTDDSFKENEQTNQRSKGTGTGAHHIVRPTNSMTYLQNPEQNMPSSHNFTTTSYNDIGNLPKEWSPFHMSSTTSVTAAFNQDNSTTLPLPPRPSKYASTRLLQPADEKQKYKRHGTNIRSRIKSVPNMVEHEVELIARRPLPPPFRIGNIHTAIGKGRGIQSGFHSNYADISIFSLFYCSNIFDNFLEEHPERDVGMKREVKRILREKIVRPLRTSAFCSWEGVCHLREAMLPLSSKLNSSFMDSEEFLYLMFENALRVPEFIRYSGGNKDFMHQIIVKPKDRSRSQDMQFLLETSMEINSLKFQGVPDPALFLCMPRCNGRLVYYEAIIPSMIIDITPLVDKGPKKCLCEMAATVECALCTKLYGDLALAYCQTCQRVSEQIHYHIGHNPVLIRKQRKNVFLHLLAVLCIRNNYYSAFVKTGVEKFAPWLYYEATPNQLPEVRLLDDFGRWLDKLEREPGRYREFAKTNVFLKRIITESHICVYYSPDHVSSGQKKEGFVV